MGFESFVGSGADGGSTAVSSAVNAKVGGFGDGRVSGGSTVCGCCPGVTSEYDFASDSDSELSDEADELDIFRRLEWFDVLWILPIRDDSTSSTAPES